MQFRTPTIAYPVLAASLLRVVSPVLIPTPTERMVPRVPIHAHFLHDRHCRKRSRAKNLSPARLFFPGGCVSVMMTG